MNNEEKERRFKYPDPNQLYLDRKIRSTYAGDILWAAAVCGRRGEEKLLLRGFKAPHRGRDDRGGQQRQQRQQRDGGNCRANGDGGNGSFGEKDSFVSAPTTITGHGGGVYHPVPAALGESLLLYWAELKEDGPKKNWHIRRCRVDTETGTFSEAEEVVRCGGAVYSLAITEYAGDHYLAWTEIREKSLPLFLYRVHPEGEGQRTVLLFSEEEDMAFRVDLCSASEGIVLTWDRYERGQYGIRLALFSNSENPGSITESTHASRSAFRVVQEHSLGREGEDWNQVRLVSSPERTLAVWVATSEVKDALGIFDRHSRVRGCEIRSFQDKPVLLSDPGNQEDGENIGDLRDGLLPRTVSKGYVGLRRNPQLSVVGNSVFLFWEVRKEEEKTSIYGSLLGREIRKDGSMGPCRCIHRGGYSYSLPKKLPASVPPSLYNPPSPGVLPLSFLRFEAEGPDILWGDFPLLHRGDASTEVPTPNPEAWRRWSSAIPEDFPGPTNKEGRRKPETRTDNSVGEGYRIFWADTHCHSIMSPDAEGEPDELILYARDRAGLDLVSIVDNDFYPHKALSRAEWVIKQELARSFSEEGRFLVLPGYEYASHLQDAVSEFNHRCVLYTAEGGPFRGRMHRETETWEGALEKLREGPVIIYPHHCGYTITDNEVERNVEVVSSWRTCIEETDFTWEALRTGKKLGFIGSSDGHRQVPGMGGAITGVLAEELTPKSIHEAYRERRLIATQGNRTRVDFTAGNVYIGSCGAAASPPRVECRIKATGKIKNVRVFRNGDCIVEVKPNKKSYSLSFQDKKISQGANWYFCRVALAGKECLNNEGKLKRGKASLFPFTNDSIYPHNMANAKGPLIWSSPVFITYTPENNKESYNVYNHEAYS